MTFRIAIESSGHTFSATDGETVLDGALREGVTLPYGCRNGACGACKGSVLAGRVDHGNVQEHALSEADRAAGLALFCCAKPLSDLVIGVAEVGAAENMPVKALPCRVEKLERITADVIVMSIKLPASERLQFLAGQYIEILTRDGKRRAFSLANSPHDDALLQLHIRHVPGGAFTEFVFNELKEKAILRFEGPHGSFYLREDSDQTAIFLASGTGFAPVKAMLEHAFHHGIQRKLILYWGVRAPADFYLLDLPKRWAAEHDNFTFVPVISEPHPGDGWQGRTGHVHQAVLDDFADLREVQVYACGAPPMVEAAHRTFTGERGLPKEAFFSDAFYFSKPG